MLPRNALHSLTARRHQRSTTRECSCADQSSHYNTILPVYRVPLVVALPTACQVCVEPRTTGCLAQAIRPNPGSAHHTIQTAYSYRIVTAVTIPTNHININCVFALEPCLLWYLALYCTYYIMLPVCFKYNEYLAGCVQIFPLHTMPGVCLALYCIYCERIASF